MYIVIIRKIKKIICISTFMMFVVILYLQWFKSSHTEFQEKSIRIETTIPMKKARTNSQTKMKYILQWTKSYTEPFIFMETGQKTFIRRSCAVDNCFITSNRSHLNNLKLFDAVLFHGPELSYTIMRMPTKKSPRQKYVFVSMESSTNYPMCNGVYNGYFNWTWTYKLDSDIYYGYLVIKNKKGDIIGPKKIMHWLKVEEMKPIDVKLKKKLNSKKIAAAWFVSHCNTANKREKIAEVLQQGLAKYNMTVDIYGDCGNKYCPRSQMKKCLRILETDYYFYFSFENTLTDDYVTEKLLHALQHYTIPIVYGGANYTRFMPEGTYLNVRNQSIEALVKQMVDIINDKQKFYDYFRWTNHYSYHLAEDFPESDYYCDFCKKINDFELVSQTSYIKNFRDWWNQRGHCVALFE